MADSRAEEAGRRSIRAWAIGLVVLLTLIVGGWLAVRVVVCDDYNSISNDFCAQWHYDTPPDDAVLVPEGWTIAWQDLSCGSGGCPTRMYVIAPPSGTSDSISLYLGEARGAGWRAREPGSSHLLKEGLYLDVDHARDNVGGLMVPSRFGKPGYLFVSVGICGEALACT